MAVLRWEFLLPASSPIELMVELMVPPRRFDVRRAWEIVVAKIAHRIGP
jgi:hypothetical protein